MHRADLPAHIAAFLDPSLYPHTVDRVEMLQTHISWIFLAGDFAYKLKKPVNFGFLDFSSLEQRHFYCQTELDLNQRTAPELYLELIEVHQNDTGFQLNGSGRLIDFGLKMHRFNQSDLLDAKFRDGHFDAVWMDSLAREVATLHGNESSVEASIVDHASLLADHIRANLDIAARHLGRALHPTIYGKLREHAQQANMSLKPLLRERQRNGFVRRCHGDLHLRNIALINGIPRIFDCIEFNDEYAIIDTMNDAAFLVMDCDARNRPDLAMRFLSRYLEICGDYSAMPLLRHYCFYRAGVRAKVACMLADELDDASTEDNGTDRETSSQSLIEACNYFELAATYCATPTVTLFAIGGLSGSGKSHLALQGAGPERAIIIRSDATRKRVIADHTELGLYSAEMNRLTYDAMFSAAETTLLAGWPVILDATFLQPESRMQVHKLAERCGVELQFYWLKVDPDQLHHRIRQRQQYGHDISDADLDILDQQLASYLPPEEPWVQVLTSSNSWPAVQSK